MKNFTYILTVVASMAINNTTAATLAKGDGSQPVYELTPGAINPDVTQRNINRTICVPGYTDTIRPRVSYTNPLKVVSISQYGYLLILPSLYELDHLIPLSIGGSPRDPKNLWPQLWEGIQYNARAKDVLESAVKRDICNKKITLAAGRRIFTSGWVKEYQLRYPSK